MTLFQESDEDHIKVLEEKESKEHEENLKINSKR